MDRRLNTKALVGGLERIVDYIGCQAYFLRLMTTKYLRFLVLVLKLDSHFEGVTLLLVKLCKVLKDR